MFVAVTLSMNDGPRVGGNKYTFWDNFDSRHRELLERRERGRESRAGYSPDQYEIIFMSSFPILFVNRINIELDNAKNIYKQRPVAMRMISVEYGSIKAIFDVVGVDNREVGEFVIALMSIYAPTCFKEALGTDVQVSSDVSVILQDIRPSGDPPTTNAVASVSNATGRTLKDAWIIANTSLIVPVGIALVICFYFLNALSRELGFAHWEADRAQGERLEIMKALTSQNEKLSTLIIEHANSAVVSTKTMEDFLLTTAKIRLPDNGSAAANPPPHQ